MGEAGRWSVLIQGLKFRLWVKEKSKTRLNGRLWLQAVKCQTNFLLTLNRNFQVLSIFRVCPTFVHYFQPIEGR
jgi:hypothetical protein